MKRILKALAHCPLCGKHWNPPLAWQSVLCADCAPLRSGCPAKYDLADEEQPGGAVDPDYPALITVRKETAELLNLSWFVAFVLGVGLGKIPFELFVAASLLFALFWIVFVRCKTPKRHNSDAGRDQQPDHKP